MTVATPSSFVSTGVYAAGICTVIGKDFQNRHDVSFRPIPRGVDTVAYCTSFVLVMYARGEANAVFVTGVNIRRNNMCYFKNVPAGAAPPSVNVEPRDPRGRLVVFNGAGRAC